MYSTDAVEQTPPVPSIRHEDTNAVSSLGLAQLVIFTEYYVLSCGRFGRILGDLDHSPSQPPERRPRHLVGLGSTLLSNQRPILGNWGHGSSHPCVSA